MVVVAGEIDGDEEAAEKGEGISVCVGVGVSTVVGEGDGVGVGELDWLCSGVGVGVLF